MTNNRTGMRQMPQNMISRRTLLGSSAAAGVLALGPRTAFAAPEELTYWTPGGSTIACEMMQNFLDTYVGRSASTASGSFQCGLGDGSNYTQTLIGSIAGGTPPDISIVWDAPVPMAREGAFMPLDEMLASSSIPLDTWPDGLMSSVQWDGKTYGLPLTSGLYTMWYNEEMFEAKGISSAREDFPKTWDELRRLSKEFTVWNGDRLETAGFMPTRNPYDLVVWSNLNGGRFYDPENKKYEINSEQNLEMLTYFMEWFEEEYKGDVRLIDASGDFNLISLGSSGMIPAFKESRQAGLMDGCWMLGDIYADPKPNFERYNLASAPVGPSGSRSYSGFWPNWFVIPTGADSAEEAFKFLEYMSVEGVVDWFALIPDVPTNLQVEAAPPNIVIETRGQEFADDLTAFLQEQAAITAPMWGSPVQNFENDQITRLMEMVYYKEASPKEALDQAQSVVQAELDRALG